VLHFQLLGPLEVRDGERVLPIRRRKLRAVLAVLALRAGEPVTPDRLVEDVWGETPPRTARHALENYVSELRRALGHDAIRTEPAGYALSVAPEQVDAMRLERLLDDDMAPRHRAERLRSELARVRGQPLEDLAFEPFAQTAVPRLLELELTAREELAGLEIELGHHADVVLALEALAREHPYREHLRALLMLALYQSGRQAEALAAYQDARRVLVEDLGIDPSEELQELERAILRQDPSLRAPPRASARLAAVRGALPSRPTRKTVTVVVARIANAGELAGRLDPEVLRALFDRFGDRVRSAVDRHGGVARVEAGRALAVFGVPIVREDDALRAVRAAAELRDGIGVLNDGLLPEHGVFLEVRTAIDTGEVLVTQAEGELATGRPVTTADELERSARPGQILLGEPAHALVRELVEVEGVSPGVHRLVGLLPDVHGRALRLDSPLVGRRRQLAALSSAFESVVTERALHLVTVLGAAGVGKSRLVREFVESVESVATLLRGQCLPYGEAITYRPLGAFLTGANDPATAVTARGAREALEELAAEHPLVLVLDDLQWAEPPLLDLVEEVAATSRDAPILLVCMARPELLEGRGTWGARSVEASSIVLDPLTGAESERLVDNLLGESDLPDIVRDHIVDTSEGNPLFVEELLATLVDRDVLQLEAGRWTTTEVQAIPVPPSIQALVSARVDRLPEAERAVLELASVEGRSFSSGSVAELSGDGTCGDLETLLAELVQKELVRPDTAGAGRYVFRHQLIRDAAYESIPLPVRADLHERLARILAVTAPGSGTTSEPVAYHRSRAETYRSTLGAI
jgi:DNA-binding SARP family transcriptional activator